MEGSGKSRTTTIPFHQGKGNWYLWVQSEIGTEIETQHFGPYTIKSNTTLANFSAENSAE